MFWDQPQSQEMRRELSINVAFEKANAGSESPAAETMAEGSEGLPAASSQPPALSENISQKLKRLSQTIRESSDQQVGKFKQCDQKRKQTQQAKLKKVIQKPDKVSKKEKLTQKVEKPARSEKPKKKKARLIEFSPNHDIEESKVNLAKPADRTSRRPKKGDRNYYQNFDFFFKRTCFRTMTLFFKMAYKPYFDQWKSNKKKFTMLESLIRFTKKQFPGLLDPLSEKARFEFIELLKLLVLSHRHNKNDDFLADPLIDFKIVREPMYKFSKQA